MHGPHDQIAIKDALTSNGFAIVRSFFDSQHVSQIATQVQRYILDVAPHVPPMDAFYDDLATKQDIRMLSRMSQHDAYFHDLLHESSLLEMAQYVWDCRPIPHDIAYFNKPPIIGEATPPHQDGYYFHLTPCEAMTVWLPLDDVDEDNGCVRYVSGSHRLGIRPHGRTSVLGFSQGIVDFGTDADLSCEVAACVRPGDVIFHDALTIHRAEANRSFRQRRAIGLVYFSSRAQVDEASRDRYQRQLAHELARERKI